MTVAFLPQSADQLVLGIDPGATQSAYSLIDRATRRPIHHAKVNNADLLGAVTGYARCTIGIEWISSYGMPVGAEVFDTCLFVGRLVDRLSQHTTPAEVQLVKRPDIKTHHCGKRNAKDSHVVGALVERFTPGQSNYGKGTKAHPGWFYGFTTDQWQAHALAVFLADQ